jgi:hypothetical protein
MSPTRVLAAATSGGWVCPACRRRFAKTRQWHSCKTRSVESHFDGKDPALRGLFDKLVRKLESSGPVRVDAVKTSIHLISRHHFGGVRVQRGSLRVGFLAREQLSSPRVVRTQTLGPNRFAHVVVLTGRKDVDAELVGWLRAAQALMR